MTISDTAARERGALPHALESSLDAFGASTVNALPLNSAMNSPVNGARGEVAVDLDGQDGKLCVTLGALAEMETEFRVTGMKALAQRLADLSARDLLVVLSILLRAGGSAALTVRDLMRRRLDPSAVARAVGSAFLQAGIDRVSDIADAQATRSASETAEAPAASETDGRP